MDWRRLSRWKRAIGSPIIVRAAFALLGLTVCFGVYLTSNTYSLWLLQNVRGYVRDQVFGTTTACPVDYAQVANVYRNLTNHLFSMRGYDVRPPYSITAGEIGHAHNQHPDTIRFQWSKKYKHTNGSWLDIQGKPTVYWVDRMTDAIDVAGEQIHACAATEEVSYRAPLIHRILQDLVNTLPDDQIPDFMDLLYNTGDGLIGEVNTHNWSPQHFPPVPIFSPDTTDSLMDLPFIYSEGWFRNDNYPERHTLEDMEDSFKHLLLHRSSRQPAHVRSEPNATCQAVYFQPISEWLAQRQSVAIWRGSTTGGEFRPNTYKQFARYRLAMLSKNSDAGLIDARITGCSQCGEGSMHKLMDELMAADLGEGDHFHVRFLTPHDYFNVRAVIDMDGNGWSSRFIQLLTTGAVVLKQKSPYKEFWYDLIREYEHYVPFERDLSDLPQQAAAVLRDNKYLHVAANALLFARTYLSLQSHRIYAAQIFQRHGVMLQPPWIAEQQPHFKSPCLPMCPHTPVASCTCDTMQSIC